MAQAPKPHRAVEQKICFKKKRRYSIGSFQFGPGEYVTPLRESFPVPVSVQRLCGTAERGSITLELGDDGYSSGTIEVAILLIGDEPPGGRAKLECCIAGPYDHTCDPFELALKHFQLHGRINTYYRPDEFHGILYLGLDITTVPLSIELHGDSWEALRNDHVVGSRSNWSITHPNEEWEHLMLTTWDPVNAAPHHKWYCPKCGKPPGEQHNKKYHDGTSEQNFCTVCGIALPHNRLLRAV